MVHTAEYNSTMIGSQRILYHKKEKKRRIFKNNVNPLYVEKFDYGSYCTYMYTIHTVAVV